MKTYLDMDEILYHRRRYIGQEYDEPYLVSAVPEEVIRSLPPADVVELPCKIGDMIYFLQRCLDSYTFVNYGDVIAFHVYRSYITVEVNDHDAFNPFVTLDVSAFGKTVFLTREEAEAALKGGHDDE